MALSDFVRSCRKRTGLTQRDLSNALNVYRETVAAWESGVQRPSYEHLEALLKLLHLSIDDCLVLPPQEASDDETAIAVLRRALAIGGLERELVLNQADLLRGRLSRRPLAPRKRSSLVA